MIRKAWILFGVIPLIAGISVILGCLTEWPSLVDFNVSYFTIAFNTAFCFVLIGLALCAAVSDAELGWRVQCLLGFSVFIIAGLTISQDLFEIDWHLDQIVQTPGLKVIYGVHPGRMAPNTALAFILASFVLMILPFAKKKMLGIGVEICIFLLFILSALCISGYLFKIDFFYSWYNYTRMALVSSVSFFSISLCLAGLWRSSSASISLYQGREDTRIILLSSAILLCMALAITIANFASLISQQNTAMGESFQRLQKNRSLYFQNEIIHAIDETNIIRSSQIFQDQINQTTQIISLADFDPILKLFAAEGFSAADIYDASGKKIASMGHFVEKAELNVKKQITNGYINILWKNGWYVQIASDVDPKKKTAGLLIVEWPLKNIDKVFSASQMMGMTGDIDICTQEGVSAACFSSRANAVSVRSQQINNQFMPEYFALKGRTGLVIADDSQYIQVLAAYGPVGILDLGMIVKMSVTELYEPITKSLRTMLPVIGLTILIGLMLLRLQVIPLVRRVINAEKGLLNSNKRLEVSEERYALAVRGSSIGLWDWDIVRDQVFYSPYFKGMLGYADTEFPNTLASFKQSLHPDDVDRVFHLIERHISHQVPYDIEFRLKRKTGDYHWFYAKGLALWDDQGNAVRMAGSLIDVTERKRSEQRLAAQFMVSRLLSEAENMEEVAEKIVRALSEKMEWDFGSVWMVDSRVNLIRCIALWYQPWLQAQALADATRNMESPMGGYLAGRTWESGQQLWLFDIVSDKSFRRAEQAKEAGLHSAFCFPICIENKVLGVLEFFVRQRQSPDESMLKVMSAITTQIGLFIKRKMAENSLRESESYKAAILESASDSIMTIGESGIILSVNYKTSEMFGYSQSELNNKNIDLLMPDFSKHLKSFSGKLVVEIQALRKDHAQFPVEITISKMFLSRQNVLVCIVRDITERKKIEKMKNEFVSVVSHELRTPITSIRGSLGLILGGAVGEFSERAKSLLAIANNNCDRLLLLINDILDIEKIEAGKMDFQLKPIDIVKLIHEAIATNKMYADKFGIQLKFDRPFSQDVLVYVDPARLMQVLTNLISNAVKFSPKDSVVELDVLEMKNSVRVTVTDVGEGVPDSFHENIFQKFSQADSSSARGQDGSGLGLSISKAIIEKLGGELNFTSKQGEKTVFYFDLPYRHDKSVNEEPGVILQAGFDRGRLLICEDDAEQATYLQMLLESARYSSDIASTVADAKKMLKEQRYLALLLDLILPDQDGITFIRELRSHDDTLSMPIIVISVLAKTGRTLLNGEALSVIDWLEKPVNFNDLLKSIENFKNNSKQKTPRILHVEDDADARQLVVSLLQEYAFVMGADSLQSARNLLKKEIFDLIILDLSLADGNGIDLLPMLAKYQLPVIVFSATGLDKSYAKYVKEVLIKSETSSKQLLEAIQKILTISEG